MKSGVLRCVAAVGAAALVLAGPAGAATKTTKKKVTKTTRKKVTTTVKAVVTTAPPATAAPATTAAAPAAPAKPSGPTIKVGFIAAETGRAASAYKTSPAVAKAWADWVNTEKGGVGGHPVEVVTADDKNDAAGAQAAAKDLVENKGVVALIVQDSTAEAALVSYVDSVKIPVVGGSANNASAGIGHGKSVNYFMTASGGPALGEAPVVIANALKQSPFSAAVCAEVAACEAGAAQSEAKAKALGLAYAGVLKISASAPNYTAECLEIQSRVASVGRSAGFVNIGVDPVTLLRVLRDCARQGYKGFVGASANVASAAGFEQVDDLQAAGPLNGFPWWSDAAPVKVFRDVMAKYNKGNEYRDPASTSSWSALELFRKAMAGAPSGNVSKDDVYKAYYGLKDETLDGLLPKPVNYTAGQPSPLMQCYWPYQYKNGKFSTLVIDATKTGNGQTGDLRSYCG